ncbi:HDIG domain-containing protein [Eubacteriales bacterium OttesenSCG-928-M02]|nr:HDIG domain-containing protein [Eubacteriales bacterium OttesenSCG-928-M02]
MNHAPAGKRERGIYRLILLAFFLVGLFVMYTAIGTKNYQLAVGDISPETILATRDIVDEITTEEQRNRAKESVLPIYKTDVAVLPEITGQVDAFFTALGNAKTTAAGYAQINGHGDAQNYREILTQGQMENLEKLLPMAVEREQLLTVLAYPLDVLSRMGQLTKTHISAVMEKGVKEEDMEDATETIAEELNKEIGLTQVARNMCITVMRNTVVYNMVLDQEATNAAIQAAVDAVSPTEYKKGQAIVREGEILTAKHIALITGLGLMAGSFNVYPYLALSLAVVLCGISYVLFGKTFERRVLRLNRASLLIGVVVLITVVLCSLLSRYELRYASVILISICITMAYSIKAGTVLACITTMLMTAMAYAAGVDSKMVLGFLVSNFISAMISAVMVDRMRSRTGIMVATVVAGIGAMLGYAIIGLANSEGMRALLLSMAYGFGGTVAVGIVALGTMPLWENLFGIITPMKLMELCNPSSPLLKRLTMEAPGTYHHSVMVANLAEAAAEAIGADSLLAWAGAYYHDVGKLMAPQYYGENQQGGMNPHDSLTPEESCAIIARHPHDGVKILKEYQLPQSFMDFAITHHGDSLMVYFANRAKEMYGPDTNMKKYRHTGRRPETKEQAIVMLADAVEAATRSNPKDMEKKVHDVIRGKMGEGQLAYTPLTFMDIKEIEAAFLGVLQGVHHTRVEYPDVDASELMQEVRGQGALGGGEEADGR